MWTLFFAGLAVFLVGSLIYLEFRPHRRDGNRRRAVDGALIDRAPRHQSNPWQDGGPYSLP